MTPYGPESGVFDAPEYPEQLEFDLNPQEFAAHAAAYGRPSKELDDEFIIPALTDEYLASGTKPLGMVSPQTGFISWDDLQADYGLTKEDFNQDEETMSKAVDE